MKLYHKGSGKKYTPPKHFDMTSEVVFGPDSGCNNAAISISTLKKGAGSDDDVHEVSDQIFYILQGAMNVYAEGKFLHRVSAGDAIMIEAGDIHAVLNEGDEDCIFYSVTTPPIEDRMK